MQQNKHIRMISEGSQA